MKWTRAWTRRAIGIAGTLALCEGLILRDAQTGGGLPRGIDGMLEMVGLLFLAVLFQYLIFVPSPKDRK
jgi:hypothetical protein